MLGVLSNNEDQRFMWTYRSMLFHSFIQTGNLHNTYMHIYITNVDTHAASGKFSKMDQVQLWGLPEPLLFVQVLISSFVPSSQGRSLHHIRESISGNLRQVLRWNWVNKNSIGIRLQKHPVNWIEVIVECNRPHRMGIRIYLRRQWKRRRWYGWWKKCCLSWSLYIQIVIFEYLRFIGI